MNGFGKWNFRVVTVKKEYIGVVELHAFQGIVDALNHVLAT